MAGNLDDELAATTDQVKRLVDMGDEVETPRKVEHLAFVPRARALAAQDDLRTAGFEITSTRRRLFRTAVEFTRTDPVDPRSAASFTREIVTLLGKHDGEYDGWGSFVVSTENQPDDDPADAVPVSQVVEAEEQARLRRVFVERLVRDGCADATAEKLASEIVLRLADGSFSLNGPTGGFWHEGVYSPSEVAKHVQGQAEDVIDDNRERRKPRWQSAGANSVSDAS